MLFLFEVSLLSKKIFKLQFGSDDGPSLYTASLRLFMVLSLLHQVTKSVLLSVAFSSRCAIALLISIIVQRCANSDAESYSPSP